MMVDPLIREKRYLKIQKINYVKLAQASFLKQKILNSDAFFSVLTQK